MKAFLKKAFCDMKEAAKAQHEVDKANFAAAKAEARAQLAEAKAMGSPEIRKRKMQRQRVHQLAAANERIAAAQKRVARVPD